MKKLLVIILLIFSLSACNDSTNPSDDSYAIEKTLTENAMTQELTSGDDIKITVIGGTIKEETEIKVKKVSATDVPNITLDKVTIGKNIFKIKIKGQKTFSPPLKIEIKYDDAYLKSKNLTTADIKGLVHLSSGWVLGTYTIDETNKKIIFSLSYTSLTSKVKDGLLADEDEITICDGYTTTDSGQGDAPIFKMKESILWNIPLLFKSKTKFTSEGAISEEIEDSASFDCYMITYPRDRKTKWSGNSFSITLDETKYGTTTKYSVNGNFSADGKTLLNYTLELSVKDYYAETTVLEGETYYKFSLTNVPYSGMYMYGHRYFAESKLSNHFNLQQAFEKKYYIHNVNNVITNSIQEITNYTMLDYTKNDPRSIIDLRFYEKY